MQGTEKGIKKSIDVKVKGLYPMPGGNYRLTGQTTFHPVNHYGTYYTVVNTRLIAEDFYEQSKATLGINDMSLIWGGGFDIYGRWLEDITSPKCRQKGYGHCSHRKGTSVDIDRSALGPKGYIRVDKIQIKKICEKNGGRLVEEATIHCEFKR
ncbi:MAG: hypothetical protein HY805_07200 [Nitrospirae bacterium]|nr:hypothetical protein [Nitrospirota bacterium]